MSDQSKSYGYFGYKHEWLFRLYVAGQGDNSKWIIKNVEDILDDYIPGDYEIEVIDVLENPLTAISDGIIATPTLLKLLPPPMIKIDGDLRESNKLLRSLGFLKSDEN